MKIVILVEHYSHSVELCKQANVALILHLGLILNVLLTYLIQRDHNAYLHLNDLENSSSHALNVVEKK